MRFTESCDGLDRCTVRAELRLTREEFAQLRELSKEDGVGDLLATILRAGFEARVELAEEDNQCSVDAG